MRRDRLERIAMAERDRRAGRVEVAVASLGEATEWPARVVLALARLLDGETTESRRILEEGLDLWAEELGLDCLDSSEALDEMLDGAEFEDLATQGAPGATVGDSTSELDRPIDNNELERAFAHAEAQTDEMLDVNEVAERVLMSESAGFASLGGDDLVASGAGDDPFGDERLPDVFGMDAAEVPPSNPAVIPDPSESPLLFAEDAQSGESFAASARVDESANSGGSRERILATLGRWLENLETASAGRTQ